jgi:hypothetical protein
VSVLGGSGSSGGSSRDGVERQRVHALRSACHVLHS